MRWPKPLLRANPNVSKKDFGHLLVVAGSAPMLGAACLVSLAAMRCGAGMVTCAISDDLNLTLQKKIDHAIMTLPYSRNSQIIAKLTRFNALAIGPGLGISLKNQRMILQVCKKFVGPIVIDADGLNNISTHVDFLKTLKSPIILTPHVGEMSRLTRLSIQYIEKNRQNVARDFAKKYNCIVVLKGPNIVIASRNKVIVNKVGNAAMAKAGMGDVLTGIIGALLAQGVSAFDAACFGVYWHSKSGQLACAKINKASLMPLDVIAALPLI